MCAELEQMIVAKFGGSVIGVDGSSITDIAKRITKLAKSSKIVAVFSAPPTMHEGRSTSLTDIVIACGELAESGKDYDSSPIRKAYDAILSKHSEQIQQKCTPLIDNHLEKFESALAEAAKRKLFADEIRSCALAYSGELLMSEIMAIILDNICPLDVRAIGFDVWPIVTDNNIESTNFMRETSLKMRGPLEKLVKECDIVTIGGFVGRSVDGTITTYERGGSDRTAADIGILFNGDYDVTIDLEKDHSVASADPRIVESAEPIFELSYNEARIAGMFGMKILDPIAIKEMHEYGMNIPVTITNMRDPTRITHITRNPKTANTNPLKIVTGKKGCAIVGIETSASVQLLESLKFKRRYEEYVILSPFTKAGIEYTRILFLDGKYVKRNDRYMRKFDPFCTVTPNRGVITLIGDQMSRAQHVVSNISACISDAGLNILNMDAQEETSRIIIVVDDSGDGVERAIKTIHERRTSML